MDSKLQIVSPETRAAIDANVRKPLPGAPPVKQVTQPASQPLTPEQARAAAKAMRANLNAIGAGVDQVLAK